MTDSHLAIFNDGDSQNTSHPIPLVTRLGQRKISLLATVIASRMRSPRLPVCLSKPGSHPVQRYFRRSFSGCLTTNAIDHHENASFGIQVKAILVVGPQKARMSFTCTSECGCCTHSASFTLQDL
jgi:hypothetical protein